MRPGPELVPALALALALAALASGPAGAQQPSGYPQLRPLDELLAQQGGGVLQPEGADALAARAAGLATRAAA